MFSSEESGFLVVATRSERSWKHDKTDCRWRVEYRHSDMFRQTEDRVEGEEEDEYVKRHKGAVYCAWKE